MADSVRAAKLSLIPAQAEHAVAWRRWRMDPDAVLHNPYETLPVDALALLLEQAGNDLADETHTVYRWMVSVGAGVVGTVSLHSVSWPHLHAKLGYQIDARHQSQGLGTAAVTALINKAFTQSRLQRLMALISTRNTASIRLAQRLGFRHEGTFKKHFLIQDRWVDEAIYSLLKSQWRPDALRSLIREP